MKVYGLFVRPNEEIELKALFVQLTLASATVNSLTGGWAVATCPLLPQLQRQPTPGPSSATAPLALAGGTSPTVQWLIAEAEKDAHYASFKAGRHHVQTNLGVISSWQFAVKFSKKHSGMPSPVTQPTVGVLCRRHVMTLHLTILTCTAGWWPQLQASCQDQKI